MNSKDFIIYYKTFDHAVINVFLCFSGLIDMFMIKI